MSEGKSGFPLFKLFGCGCGCFVVISLICFSFFIGAKYGKDLLDKTSDRLGRVFDNVSEEAKGAKDDAAKTIDNAAQDAPVIYEDNGS